MLVLADILAVVLAGLKNELGVLLALHDVLTV
jgi:hypothetical protein